MAIEIKNICKSFGSKQVLDNVSMTFHEGITCIMGPSGIGKTTLINIIAGLLAPDTGCIIGREGKKLSFVFQEDRLLEWESALANVLFVSKSARKDQENARKLLVRAGLGDSIQKKAALLSGGMKRRVCLCRALIADANLLILDEPFKGLDGGMKPDIMAMVKDHSAKDKSNIVICITHDPAEAEFLGATTLALA